MVKDLRVVPEKPVQESNSTVRMIEVLKDELEIYRLASELYFSVCPNDRLIHHEGKGQRRNG
jgi:hypothetical protein